MAQSSLAAEARGNKGFALGHFETLRVFKMRAAIDSLTSKLTCSPSC